MRPQRIPRFAEGDFRGAHLDGAYLTRANLEGSKNITPEQIIKTRSLEKAKMPDFPRNKIDDLLDADMHIKIKDGHVVGTLPPSTPKAAG